MICFAERQALANRYNVLFIAVDDLRPELGCFGARHAQSPHLDQLAKESVIFANHFVQVPTCGASRYALLTGRSPATSGVTSRNAAFYQGRSALAREQLDGAQSMPELFRRSGYRTVCIGKISHTPDGRVFSYNGKGDGRDEVPNAWDDLPTPFGAWKRGWGTFFAYANGLHREDGQGHRDVMEFVAKEDDDLPDGMMATTAIDKLTELKKLDQPFFLGVGFFKPHLPLVATKADWDSFDGTDIPLPTHAAKPASAYWHGSGEFFKYDFPFVKQRPLSKERVRHARRAYLACVRYVDRQIGRVLDALRTTGLADSTIVVVWGDHGWHLGDSQLWGKHTPFERALRSPLMVRVPGMATAGKTSHALVETIDVFPTLVDLCQTNFKQTAKPLDGKSLRPLLDNPEASFRDAATSYWRNAVTVRTKTHRLVVARNGNELKNIELYDIRKTSDPVKNLAAQEPELVNALIAEFVEGNSKPQLDDSPSRRSKVFHDSENRATVGTERQQEANQRAEQPKTRTADKQQEARLKAMNLERALASEAREQHDSLKSAHHFLRAAELAQSNHKQGFAQSFLLAAKYEVDKIDRTFVHDGMAQGALATKDETQMLTWGDDGAVRLWDLQTGSLLRTLDHGSGVNTATLNADETRLLTWCDDADARLWDLSNGKLVRRFSMQNPHISRSKWWGIGGAIFGADESRVLTWSSPEARVKVWDVKRAEPLLALENGATHAAFFKDDDHILIWSKYFKTPEIWNVKNKQKERAFERIKAGTDGAFASLDRTRFITRPNIGSDEKEVLLWDVGEDKPLRSVKHGKRRAVFSLVRTRFLTTDGGPVWIWDDGDDLPIQTIHPAGEYEDAVFSQAGDRLLTWTADGTLQLWEVETGRLLRKFQHNGQIFGAAFNSDDTQILAWGNGVRLWTMEGPWQWSFANWPPIRTFDPGSRIVGAAFHNDETQILAWGEGGVRLWNVHESQLLRTYRHEGMIDRAVFNHDCTRVVTFGFDYDAAVDLDPRPVEHSDVRVWSVNQDKPLHILKHAMGATSAKFLNDQDRLVTYNYLYNTTRIWDLSRKEPSVIFEGKASPIEPIFTKDESHFLICNKDKVEFWHVNQDQPIQTFPHDESVLEVVLNRKESHFLTRIGNKVCFWNIMLDTPVRVFNHDDNVRHVAFSTDGKRVLTHAGKKVTLWDVQRDQPIRSFQHDGFVTMAMFNADESRIISRSVKRNGSDPKLNVWDATDGKRLRTFPLTFSRLVFSNDRNYALDWTKSHELKLFDLRQNEPVRVFRHHDEFSRAAFDSAAKRILTWRMREVHGRAVYLWDIEQDEPVRKFIQGSGVNGAAFNADESRLLTWGGGTVKLWDVEQDLLLRTFRHNGDATFNSDESAVLTWGSETANLWDISLPNEQSAERQEHEFQIRSGTFLDEYGRLRRLSFKEWRQLAARKKN
ncbi:MAG: sulfatase-like hydrolase/transferase [Planctomycetes bacterium]|nr:sulfatase-like hydrolase/transferase [Planctomycetota bacterium]